MVQVDPICVMHEGQGRGS